MKKSSTTTSLKSVIASHFYLIAGSDTMEVKRLSQEKADALTPQGSAGFGLEILTSQGENSDEALQLITKTEEALLTFPFFSDGKVVWLKDPAFLRDTPASRSMAVQERLEQLLKLLQSGWPQNIIFIISAPGADKRRSFYKKIFKLAQVTICDQPENGTTQNEYDQIAWVERKATQRGITLNPKVAEMIVVRIGTSEIDLELEKLATAAGPNTPITLEMAAMLLPQTRTGSIFDLSNAIFERNLEMAYKKVDQLLYQGESVIGILLAAIVPTLRNLLLVKELMLQHRLAPPAKPFFFASSLKKLPTAATQHLPRKKDGSLNSYPLGLAAMHLEHFNLSELQTAFLNTAELYHSLITTSHQEEELLKLFLLKLLGVRLATKSKKVISH